MSSLTIKNILKRLLEWVKENKRLRTAAVICVVLLCVDLLLYSMLIVPSAGWLHSMDTKYAEIRKKRTETILFQKQKQELAGVLAGIQTQKDMPLLIKELVQTARRLNLSVASITYDIPKRSGDDLAMLSFSFPAEGKYPDIKRFIYEIETQDRLVGIQDLKLEEATGRVKLDMKLITYIKGQ